MEVTFIRHGESQHNVEYKRVGKEAYYDTENKYSRLTEKGQEEAFRRSFDLDINDFQVVITSSLPRTLETTDIIFDTKETTVVVLDIVRENILEHTCNTRKSISEIKKEYPDFDTSYLIGENDNLEARYNDVVYRYGVLEHLLKVLSEEGIKKVAIVSHNDFITGFLGISHRISHCGRIDIIF